LLLNKKTFVSFKNSYHGDTTGAMSLADLQNGMHQKFSNLLLQNFCLDLPKDLEDFEGGTPKETKLFGFFEDGGSVAEGNYEMLMSNIKAIKHHAEELEGAVKPNTEIEAWVLSKSERAETDLSDITHYLEGNKDKMSMGGTIRHYAHKMDKK
jgi:hypothetical protein